MKILVADDEKNIRDTIVDFLKLEGIDAYPAENGLSARRMLETEVFKAAVIDLKMPHIDGLSLLKWIQEEGPAIPVIMISAYGDIKDAVEAMKIGARDYIVKPFDPEELIIRLKRIIENQELKDRVELDKPEDSEFKDWIGKSPLLIQIKKLVEKIAPTHSTVLITGESGTGKELIARTIHRLSTRAGSAFVDINIGGIPENLLESELFGHERGAFTGADSRKIGMFELASPGTIFLDEIGDMPIQLQVKLLRVIQERKMQRLGGTQSIPVDARIVAATNSSLEEKIKQGLFREDLYYRLNVIRIEVPPLRECREDIPTLSCHFINKLSNKIGRPIQGIDPEALKSLQSYSFPGNIRELENIIERAVILAETDTIRQKDLGIAPNTPRFRIKSGTLDQNQKQVILEALSSWEGNRTRAADELGISRQTLLNKIKEYGLE
ncbi:MAG: sigma-54 dependent transcriptional regulator [Spirochaetia bacterium]|jgi:two-component system response regulator AtoC|nr:sigma-54 dependent transcriptional regulator [Spirochaetia bacterium]